MTTFDELSHILSNWQRRLRLQRTLSWSLRGLALGFAVGLILGTVGVLQARLVRTEFLILIAALTVVMPLLAGLIAYLLPIERVKAARTFDRVFHLNERISTALEMHGKPFHPMLQQQLDDALTSARNVNPSRDLPLKFNWREGVLALVFAGLLTLVWFRGEEWFQAAQRVRNVEEAVAEQQQQIEELLTEINNNEALTEEQKEALSEPLEQALNELEQNPSMESSVSVLTNTGEQLQAMSDPQTVQTTQALQQTGQELASQEGSPLEGVGEELADGNFVNAAAEMANIDVSQLDAGEAQQLSDQLEQMADALEATNPELAEKLNEAAEALQRGDYDAAQRALDEAAQEMMETGQQVAFSQQADQAAQEMQQGAGQVMAAGGGQQSQQGQTQAGQQGENGQSGQNSGDAGSGSGSGEADGSSSPGDEAGSSPIEQDATSDGGESAYEQIYAPQFVGGENGESLGLPSSGEEGDVIGQGPTTPSEDGESLVPYTEVYSQYETVNQEAIENGNVPFEFLQIIRNYFDSLEP